MAISQPNRVYKNTIKFMQVLDKPTFQLFRREAQARGITVQELIRAVALPEWFFQLPPHRMFDRKNKELIVQHQREAQKTIRAVERIRAKR